MHYRALSNHFMQPLVNCVSLIAFLTGAVKLLSNYLVLRSNTSLPSCYDMTK
jgi:hypothetical protein